MPTEVPRAILEVYYQKAAEDYLRKLRLENFMEATSQGTQRAITLASLAIVRAQRSDVHVFNELLLQYPGPRRKRPGQVVPDNTIVLYPGTLKVEGSYDVPLQPVGPFWVLEYVSKSNKRKDYHESMQKYEHELKVPYYLIFYPDNQELSLFHHNGTKYVSVGPNEQGRFPIPELELEAGLLEGWVRYWLKGVLIPLPAELAQQRDEAQRQRDDAQRQRDDAQRQRDREREARLAAEAEVQRLREELARLKGQQ